jgi:hypothetical protein
MEILFLYAVKSFRVDMLIFIYPTIKCNLSSAMISVSEKVSTLSVRLLYRSNDVNRTFNNFRSTQLTEDYNQREGNYFH